MVTSMARAVFGLALIAVLAAPTTSAAQDAVLTQLYGAGVHQYFSGNYNQAYSDLSAAVNAGSKDPRVFYFRALAAQRMGGDARADLMMGASLENDDVNGIYPVGKSLERVQGATRLSLERYRAAARAQNSQRQQQRDNARYEQRKRAEAEVLRAPTPPPPPLPKADDVPPPDAAAPADSAEDPFAEKPEGDEPADAEPKDDAAADEDAPAEEMPAEDADAPVEDAPAEDAATDEASGDEPAAEDAAEGEEMTEKGEESTDPFADDDEKKPE